MKKIHVLILLICLFVPLSMSGCKNKDKKTLSTPTISSITNGTIVFDNVSNAEYYTLLIDDYELSINAQNSGNVQIVGDKVIYDASKIFVVGETYSLKIRANSSKAHNSEFSEAFTYKYLGKINTPTNVKTHLTTLSWDVVENASHYLVKVVTPNDKILFDKNGNTLTGDDIETIENADLTEFSFNSNQFNFSSLLNEAGQYKFYVKAVQSDETTYIESDYSQKVTYTHYVELNAPSNGQVYNIDNELHLVTSLDKHANAISISCANIERTVEINGAETSVNMLSDNLADINLTQYFQSFILAEQLTFDDITQYTFKTQSKFIPTGTNESFYIDSNLSSAVLFENTVILSAPELSLVFSETNNCYVAKWITPNTKNTNLIGEFKVIVFTPEGTKEYKLDSDVTSMLIKEDFLAVAVQTIGVGNYLTSPISKIITNPNLTKNIANITIETTGSGLSWTNVDNAYYFIACGTNFYHLTSNTFEIPVETLSSNNQTITIATFVENHKPLINSVNLKYIKKLSTPTFGASQGFYSKKLYELTFTGSENAIGYYVWIKSKDASEFMKINTLYTSTTIDLSQYIITEGEYTDYEVKVQAVADIHSVYSDSDLSESISVSHMKVLPKPEFYKNNNQTTPVTKLISNGTVKYVLKFQGIEDAGSYEVLINYNKLTIDANPNSATGIYEIDITKYLTSANNYEIKIRSIPKNTSFNISPSEYNVTNYAFTKQLSMVENIVIEENDGVFTISFKGVDNAESYSVRIVKENDSDYVDYLKSLGLNNPFEITESTDVSQYVKQQGAYKFYVTALASKENSYYADSAESTSFAEVTKLTTLDKPTNITFDNQDKDTYLLNWDGDDNADYYLIRIKDPNGIEHEFKVFNATSVNINDYISVQGKYDVTINSMVQTTGGNSKEFASSSGVKATETYLFKETHDFSRYSVFMYGNYYDFVIENVDDLKNILWYNYLYEIDINTKLSLLISRKYYTPEGETETKQETLRESILRIANESSEKKYYIFTSDEKWLDLNSETLTTDSNLFLYLCEKLLSIYPEFNSLSNFSVDHSTGNDIFTLYYKNALNGEKTAYPESNTFYSITTNENYGNDFEYIDPFLRKSESGVFKIDTLEETMLVSTTEQLLHAVQHNRKPIFIGDCSVAETVYNNAKLVLSAIVSDKMTDLEKVTAIFDWLEANFDLTYYKDNSQYYISGSIEHANDNIKKFGQYKHYYLEGIFEDIKLDEKGDIIVGSNRATSKSYSKAFTLLCAIEGIESVVVNGEYTYTTGVTHLVNHSWNKVKVSTTMNQTDKQWYSLDLTFSDNRIVFTDMPNGYGMSSHIYFLTDFRPSTVTLTDKNNLISNKYQSDRNSSENTYNYYANSTFSMTSAQIQSSIKIQSDEDPSKYYFTNYTKQYNDDISYLTYKHASNLKDKLESYLLNAIIYAKHKLLNNKTKRSCFEFRYEEGEFDKDLFNNAVNSGKNLSLGIEIINSPNNEVVDLFQMYNSRFIIFKIKSA